MISQAAYYTASQPFITMQHKGARKVLHALRNKKEMNQKQLCELMGYQSRSGAEYIIGVMVKCGMLDVREEWKHKFYKINVYNMREIRNATKTLNGIRLENQ